MALVVRGAIKDYDWGIIDGLATWSGEITGGPQAELWFGVHPGGPSPLLDPGGAETGEHLGDRFDIEAIPLLVKLLAAAKPLSVQIHPDADTARAGWAAQQAPGAPRPYNDPFEKTEMLVALSDFQALAGWRDTDQAIAILSGVDGCQAMIDALRAGDLAQAIRHGLQASTSPAIAQIPGACAAAGLSDDQCQAYALITREYPNDAGALITVLLQYVHLLPGQAIYVPAGIPHSYICGTGLEVMTSSDNVLRLGLTGKSVFVDQAIAALGPHQPQIIDAQLGDILWPVNAPFVVRVLPQGLEKLPAGAYRIVLSIQGSATVRTDFADIGLKPGTAAVMSAQDADAWVDADGLVAVVQATSPAR